MTFMATGSTSRHGCLDGVRNFLASRAADERSFDLVNRTRRPDCIAAGKESLAEPGGICISRVVRDQIRDKLPYPFEDRGEQSVKNIARSVRVFALRPEAVAELPATSISALASRQSRIAPVAIATAGALVIAVSAWWLWPTKPSNTPTIAPA